MAPKANEDKPESQREILREIQQKTDRMYNAIMGDPELKIYGLSHRVNKLEYKEAKRNKFYALLSTISAGIAVGTLKMYEFFHTK